MDASNPADDLRELQRLARVAITASYEGGWTEAYAAHCKHYDLICERCRDPAYNAEYLAAAQNGSVIADRRTR